MVLTVSFALSPVTGLVCHRHRRNHFRRLDTSVGASGPRDFAVRLPRRSSAALSASTASRPAAVTIACRPSVGRNGGGYRSDLGQERTGIFLREGLDTGVAEQPVGQIREGAERALSSCTPVSPVSAAKRQDLCGYKWAAHLIFEGEHIQIEAF